jgi:hypothetical protein
MLDSPEGVCAGQAGFEYPATSVPFSNFDPLRSSATCRNGCPLSGSLYFADKPPMAVAGHPRRMKCAGHPVDVGASWCREPADKDEGGGSSPPRPTTSDNQWEH